MPTDASDLTMALCERFGVNANYVMRVELDVKDGVTFHCYKGRDGFCKGPKYVIGAYELKRYNVDDNLLLDDPFMGQPAMESPITFEATF